MMVDIRKNSSYSLTDGQPSDWKKKFWENRFARFIIVILLIAIAVLITWEVYTNITNKNYLGFHESNSILGRYSKHSVSTDGAHCADIGNNLLARGGSAVDAAIGTLLCMGVVLPNSMGIGGGCLMTIYDTRTRKAVSINGREKAPHYAHEDMFHGDGLASSRGPLSIGVPGELAAYKRAHEMYGKLAWKELFADTIDMAENGAPLVAHMASALRDPRHAKYMSPPLREIFTNKTTNKLLNTGDIYKNQKLADTLKKIRDNGVEEFYTGETGRLFIDDLTRQGGQMTVDDLKNYTTIVSEALDFKITPNITLYTQPLPGSGIVLGVILRIMQRLGYYGKRNISHHYVNSTLYYHHLVESFKFAYGQRAGLEDQPEDSQRLSQLMDKLSSDEYIESIVAKIDDKSHDNSFYGGLEEFGQDAGTAHVSVLDESGLAVAVTTSVNLYFGSGLYSNSTGIIYNDIMDDFVLPNVINKFGVRPSNYNRIRPGRRPISSMAPSVFADENGRVRLIIGASGGTQITTGIAFVSLRHLYLGDDIKTAIDARRIHHQFLPNEVVFEKEFPELVIDSLEDRNHTCKQLSGRPSVVMAIANEPGPGGINRITANSDGRKGGAVAGV